jgi:phosphohistidine swiveling domain-containing protein
MGDILSHRQAKGAVRIVLQPPEIRAEDQSLVGSKALSLATIARAGFPVPAFFCITSTVYRRFISANGLEPAIQELSTLPAAEAQDAAARLQGAIRLGQLSGNLRTAIRVAYRQLDGARAGWSPVAVRSSATAEDLPEASFAGQQATLLNVRGEAQLLRGILECWASLWSRQAIAYRAQRHGTQSIPTIAVVVQRMVAASTAGVAFSKHPIIDKDEILIESALGLGDMVVSGKAEVDCYSVSRSTLLEAKPPVIARKTRKQVVAAEGGLQVVGVPAQERDARALSPQQVREIASTVLALEQHFGCPQDMEWAMAQGQFYVLQSRPITTEACSIFTDNLPADDHVWTSGFLNERFPLAVSPLGWSLIRELLDDLAFRDPLRYLGTPDAETLPITKLYRAHPYVNMLVFQMLYKLFPESLLPEDACRYFPAGRTELRRLAPYPRSLLDPCTLLSIIRHFLREPRIWSPWHNDQVWSQFVSRHDARSQALDTEEQILRQCHPTTQRIWTAIEEAQQLNRELLSLHRWSLTDADMTYSLLRRLVRAWAKEGDALELTSRLVTGLPNKSLETNQALQRLSEMEDPATFAEGLELFLVKYGHRSFHLDIYYPTFADEPAQVIVLVERLRESAGKNRTISGCEGEAAEAKRRVDQLCGSGPLAWIKRKLLDHVLHLAQRYMPLREDQRFYWQKTLALMRRLFLILGQSMVEEQLLDSEQDVFFLTKSEIQIYVQRQPNADPLRDLAKTRRRQFERLSQEFETAPSWAYPPFLRGNMPLEGPKPDESEQLKGRAVSPGLAKGRVVVLLSPTDFGKVQAGDVLVAPSADPAWTPIFSLLSAVVTEHGGQLSHAAVVAREYKLPAVTGIPSVTRVLHDGDTVIVDGLHGIVAKIEEP